MLVGALKMPPQVTGKVTGLRNAEAIRKMPGVRAVVQAPDAAIVVAQHYWQARKAADALELEIDPGAAQDCTATPSWLPASPRSALPGPSSPPTWAARKTRLPRPEARWSRPTTTRPTSCTRPWRR